MKNLSILLISVISLLWVSCKKENNLAPDEPYLNKVTELRYFPDDSVTVKSELDPDGVIRLETSSKNGFIKGVRENSENRKDTESWSHYRLYTFNKSNKLIKLTQYGYPALAVSMSDSSIYSNSLLVKKELKSFWLNADGDNYFRFPLWVTKRSFTYDTQNRLTREADSVFICHDIAKGEVIVSQSAPKFIFTTTNDYTYNSKNELVTKKTISTRNYNLTYSNGWNVYSATNPGKLYIGTTNYTYDYDSDNRLITKNASFIHAQTNQVYNSVFSYYYTN